MIQAGHQGRQEHTLTSKARPAALCRGQPCWLIKLEFPVVRGAGQNHFVQWLMTKLATEYQLWSFTSTRYEVKLGTNQLSGHASEMEGRWSQHAGIMSAACLENVPSAGWCRPVMIRSCMCCVVFCLQRTRSGPGCCQLFFVGVGPGRLAIGASLLASIGTQKLNHS